MSGIGGSSRAGKHLPTKWRSEDTLQGGEDIMFEFLLGEAREGRLRGKWGQICQFIGLVDKENKSFPLNVEVSYENLEMILLSDLFAQEKDQITKKIEELSGKLEADKYKNKDKKEDDKQEHTSLLENQKHIKECKPIDKEAFLAILQKKHVEMEGKSTEETELQTKITLVEKFIAFESENKSEEIKSHVAGILSQRETETTRLNGSNGVDGMLDTDSETSVDGIEDKDGISEPGEEHLITNDDDGEDTDNSDGDAVEVLDGVEIQLNRNIIVALCEHLNICISQKMESDGQLGEETDISEYNFNNGHFPDLNDPYTGSIFAFTKGDISKIMRFQNIFQVLTREEIEAKALEFILNYDEDAMITIDEPISKSPPPGTDLPKSNPVAGEEDDQGSVDVGEQIGSNQNSGAFTFAEEPGGRVIKQTNEGASKVDDIGIVGRITEGDYNDVTHLTAQAGDQLAPLSDTDIMTNVNFGLSDVDSVNPRISDSDLLDFSETDTDRLVSNLHLVQEAGMSPLELAGLSVHMQVKDLINSNDSSLKYVRQLGELLAGLGNNNGEQPIFANLTDATIISNNLAGDLINMLEPISIESDSTFFSSLRILDNSKWYRVVRFILYALENRLSQENINEQLGGKISPKINRLKEGTMDTHSWFHFIDMYGPIFYEYLSDKDKVYISQTTNIEK